MIYIQTYSKTKALQHVAIEQDNFERISITNHTRTQTTFRFIIIIHRYLISRKTKITFTIIFNTIPRSALLFCKADNVNLNMFLLTLKLINHIGTLPITMIIN